MSVHAFLRFSYGRPFVLRCYDHVTCKLKLAALYLPELSRGSYLKVTGAIQRTYQRTGPSMAREISPGRANSWYTRERSRNCLIAVGYSVELHRTREKGRERERERERERGGERKKCPVWGFNWQKRGSTAMAKKSGGKRVERGER